MRPKVNKVHACALENNDKNMRVEINVQVEINVRGRNKCGVEINVRAGDQKHEHH